MQNLRKEFLATNPAILKPSSCHLWFVVGAFFVIK